MADRVRATRLEHAEEAVEVRRDIGPRMVERMAHPRLRGEVHDAIGVEVCQQRPQAVVVGDVEMGESEPLVRVDLSEPLRFKLTS